MHGLVNCEGRVRKRRRIREKMEKEGVKVYVAVCAINASISTLRLC